MRHPWVIVIAVIAAVWATIYFLPTEHGLHADRSSDVYMVGTVVLISGYLGLSLRARAHSPAPGPIGHLAAVHLARSAVHASLVLVAAAMVAVTAAHATGNYGPEALFATLAIVATVRISAARGVLRHLDDPNATWSIVRGALVVKTASGTSLLSTSAFAIAAAQRKAVPTSVVR